MNLKLHAEKLMQSKAIKKANKVLALTHKYESEEPDAFSALQAKEEESLAMSCSTRDRTMSTTRDRSMSTTHN